MKLYIETSVLGFLFARDAPDKMKVTMAFFKKLKKYKCYISDTVLEEIEKTPGRRGN
jgi:hypothetical protein